VLFSSLLVDDAIHLLFANNTNKSSNNAAATVWLKGSIYETVTYGGPAELWGFQANQLASVVTDMKLLIRAKNKASASGTVARAQIDCVMVTVHYSLPTTEKTGKQTRHVLLETLEVIFFFHLALTTNTISVPSNVFIFNSFHRITRK
jgi:hypothetical protein